jgi:hypothetical protein
MAKQDTRGRFGHITAGSPGQETKPAALRGVERYFEVVPFPKVLLQRLGYVRKMKHSYLRGGRPNTAPAVRMAGWKDPHPAATGRSVRTRQQERDLPPQNTNELPIGTLVDQDRAFTVAACPVSQVIEHGSD